MVYHMYWLFIDMKNGKINNERMRNIILGFIWGQPNLEFYSLKYRNKIAKILKHVYGTKMTSVLLTIAQKAANVGHFVVGTEKEMKILNDSILKYYNGDSLRAFKLLLFIFKKEGHNIYGVSEFPVLNEYQKAKVDITSVTKVPEEVLLGMVASTSHPQYHSLWSTAIQREATKALVRKNVTVLL